MLAPGDLNAARLTYEGTIAKAVTLFVLALLAAGFVGFVPLFLGAVLMSLVVAFNARR